MTLLAWLNFISPAKDYFSPSETCLIQILAHWMYLSFGATLELIGICTCTVWSVGVPAIINECVLCFRQCMQDASLGTSLVLTHFLFFQDMGEDCAAPSESLWTIQLQLSRVRIHPLMAFTQHPLPTSMSKHLPGFSLWSRCSRKA